MFWVRHREAATMRFLLFFLPFTITGLSLPHLDFSASLTVSVLFRAVRRMRLRVCQKRAAYGCLVN